MDSFYNKKEKLEDYDDINGLPDISDINKFNERLHNGWLQFLNGEHPQEYVRASILNSWKRSAQAIVDPFTFTYTFLPQSELEVILAQEKELIEVAHSIMGNLLAFNPNGHINLTNADGVTLAYCGLDFTPVGSILRESVLGTNSTARCLIEKRLVYTASEENWKIALRERNQHCAAAPIKNAEGKLIGVLTLTGVQDKFNQNIFNQHTLGTVQAAAEAISQQLILRQLLAEQQSILETLNEGVIVVNNKGTIKTVNRYARQIFNNIVLEGKNLDKALNPDKTQLLSMEPCNDREIIFAPSKTSCISCLISLMKTPDGGRVLSLRENQRIRAITRRVMGAGASYTFGRIVGNSEALRQTLNKARTCSRTDSTVLLTGESGTGKELFAQAIHNASARGDGPFIAVNCGAIPRDLVQSELFGYVDGAYTGARSGGAPGKFELAEGGTLFLDEIGEMPLEAQTSLLRVLQEGEVVRVGAAHPSKLNVRIIAATNCDLVKAVEISAFRRDLYYRLNVISIPIPALRDRADDICQLVTFFTDRICNNLKRISPQFSAEALEYLRQYDWPGNIRELENIVERIVNMHDGLSIEVQDLPDEILQSTSQETEQESQPIVLREPNSLKSKEKEHIIQVLAENSGNIKKSAEELGISRPSLYNKLKRWKVDVAEYRNYSAEGERTG